MLVLDINLPGRSGLDVLAALADGGEKPRTLVLSSHPEEQYALRVIRAGAMGYLNKSAPAAAVLEAAKRMGEGGRIITVGSVNGEVMPFAGGAFYAGSKAAVRMLTKGWARDLGERGITVNVVQPGPIDTDMNPAEGPFAEMLTAMTARKRYGKPEEVAELVAFLAGPAAANITGAALTTDGGMTA